MSIVVLSEDNRETYRYLRTQEGYELLLLEFSFTRLLPSSPPKSPNPTRHHHPSFLALLYHRRLSLSSHLQSHKRSPHLT